MARYGRRYYHILSLLYYIGSRKLDINNCLQKATALEKTLSHYCSYQLKGYDAMKPNILTQKKFNLGALCVTGYNRIILFYENDIFKVFNNDIITNTSKMYKYI